MKQVTELPPIDEILDDIPDGGIDIRELAKKYKIDETNLHLFYKLLKATCKVDIRVSKLPEEERCNKNDLVDICEAAKKAPEPRRKLTKNEFLYSRLVGDITMYVLFIRA